MSLSEPSRGAIGFRVAMILFALLAIAAFVTLKGMALFIALIIVGGVAVKAWVHHMRGRIEP